MKDNNSLAASPASVAGIDPSNLRNGQYVTDTGVPFDHSVTKLSNGGKLEINVPSVPPTIMTRIPISELEDYAKPPYYATVVPQHDVVVGNGEEKKKTVVVRMRNPAIISSQGTFAVTGVVTVPEGRSTFDERGVVVHSA